MLIEWKEEYSVNVKEIDNQHKKLVEIINSLYSVINNIDIDDKKLVVLFADLISYADLHFNTEEGYFDKFGYPESKHHKDAHKLFRKKIFSLITQYKKKKIEATFELVDFLEDWFLGHLAIEDKKYSKFFNDHGLF